MCRVDQKLGMGEEAAHVAVEPGKPEVSAEPELLDALAETRVVLGVSGLTAENEDDVRES